MYRSCCIILLFILALPAQAADRYVAQATTATVTNRPVATATSSAPAKLNTAKRPLGLAIYYGWKPKKKPAAK